MKYLIADTLYGDFQLHCENPSDDEIRATVSEMPWQDLSGVMLEIDEQNWLDCSGSHEDGLAVRYCRDGIVFLMDDVATIETFISVLQCYTKSDDTWLDDYSWTDLDGRDRSVRKLKLFPAKAGTSPTTHCKNHIGDVAHRRCRRCDQPICDSCYQKHQQRIGRMKVGFCSADCLTTYEKTMSELRAKNRVKALKKIAIGFICFATYFIVNSDNIGVVAGENISVGLRLIWLLVLAVGVSYLSVGIRSITYGSDPDLFDSADMDEY